MATRQRTILLGMVWILGTGVATAVSPGTTVDLSVEVVANLLTGAAGVQCTADAEIEPGKPAEWWVAIADVRRDLGGAGEKLSRRIECGTGRFAKALDATGSSAPPLLLEISTTPVVLAGHDPYLDILLRSRKRASVDSGNPLYQETTEKRNFVFSEGSDLLVPLPISSPQEGEALGIHEGFLRLAARVSNRVPRAAYGALWIVSDLKGARVLLDGGVVASIPEGGEAMLRNVLAGRRDVRVRDATGHEVRRLVRLPEQRTVLVELNGAAPAGTANPYGIASLGKNANGFEEYRRARDSAVVVRIPGGEFLMGNPRTEAHPLEHRVTVSEFVIDKTLVTWKQYKRFAGATLTPLPPHEPYWGIHDDHPAVFVTWEEAKAYCEWVGGRLPTEAEFEKAARGTDDRMFPWGNEEATHDRATYRHSWGYEATDPVGTHPSGASPYGLLDMAGNVWEWCADWYDEKYYEVSPAQDPKGPASGQAHVVRGGSWDSRPDVLSCSRRSFGYKGYREGDFGFRCAMNF